ncbi:hypothetical protein BCR44DRAFT_1498275 [Catenaria anguillulae PL171]|uniref:Uncharacterized protein n=1 Tax=Catenaria anguillulae PL171 TaxID=765915 RepID=A0A1Y2HUN3_9FUNG|nr:hypothetical protein BCR44DRAFT_1498275 [Catenaria anguillulae PL171]
MAGGPQTYIIAGAKVPSRYLAVGTLAAIAGLGMMLGGGKKAEAPVAQQIKQLPSEEGDFVAKFMAELEKDEKPAKAH